MLRLRVSNMTCGGCAKGVSRAVQSVAPEATVEVDLPAREIFVRGPADGPTVVASLRRSGFEAAQLQPEPA